DHLVVELEPRDLDRSGAGRQDDALARREGRLLAVLARHLDRRSIEQLRGALDEIDLVALEQGADPARELLDDAGLPLLHRPDVHLDAAELEAHHARVLHLLGEVRRGDEGLRRDAAPVEAHPADLLAFDDDRLDLELAEPDSGLVATRAT